MSSSPETSQVAPVSGKMRVPGYFLRCSLALFFSLGVCLYAYGIIAGRIPPEHKLSGVDVGLILVTMLGVGLLLRPELLERLTNLKVGSFELKLDKLQRDQQAQQSVLNDIRFVLTMLLQDTEREQLQKLEKSEAYATGNHDLRTGLRKLRALDLIRSINQHRIAEIKDGVKVDLKDFVELTQRGDYYLQRIREDQESISKTFGAASD